MGMGMGMRMGMGMGLGLGMGLGMGLTTIAEPISFLFPGAVSQFWAWLARARPRAPLAHKLVGLVVEIGCREMWAVCVRDRTRLASSGKGSAGGGGDAMDVVDGGDAGADAGDAGDSADGADGADGEWRQTMEHLDDGFKLLLELLDCGHQAVADAALVQLVRVLRMSEAPPSSSSSSAPSSRATASGKASASAQEATSTAATVAKATAASSSTAAPSATAGGRVIEYRCDYCDQYPLRGKRWHCEVCADYDLW